MIIAGPFTDYGSAQDALYDLSHPDKMRLELVYSGESQRWYIAEKAEPETNST